MGVVWKMKRRRRTRKQRDADQSKHTVRWIMDSDLDHLMATAKGFKHEGWYENISPDLLIEFAYLTGCHPIVLANPTYYDLRSQVVGKHLHVLWSRPKKTGLAASMDLPLAEVKTSRAKWIPEFIHSLHQHTYTTQHINRMLREIGKKAGVPVSMRTLRHTCGVRIARESRDIAVVCWWLNVTPRVAAMYLRLSSSSDPRMLEMAGRI